MTQITSLLNLSHVTIHHIATSDSVVIITLHSETREASCPLCSQPAIRVQSRYQRTVQDLPLQGKTLRLRLHVRRFFCDNPACQRKMFAERFPELTSAYARRTTRLTTLLSTWGLTLGGKTTTQIGHPLGIRSSRDTVLRIVRRTSLPEQETPRILGVDDWAFRRGISYGTLLVDLERGQPIEMLADRQASTLATWLKQHPCILAISRDRAGEYALGAKQGALEALQIADRFHLTKNLSEVAERILAHHRQALRSIRFVPASATSSSPLAVRYLRPARERRKHEVQQARQARAEQIQSLVAQGMTQQTIARLLHLNRKTVALSAHTQTVSLVSRPARAGILAPFTRYLSARWHDGERNGVGLYREIAAQGYTGSRMTVERFLLGLRALEQQGHLPAVLAATVEMTPHRAIGLLLKRAENRTEEEARALLQVSQVDAALAQTQRLMQQFLKMLRERHGEELDAWLEAAMHSGIPEWRAFARKLRQDHAAVWAGLTLKWNNGPVEGHINRLKFLKRSMYGRAKFDLLRLRVLYHQRECA